MKKKPEAWMYEDKDGVCAMYCRNKEEAQKVMQQIIDEESQGDFGISHTKVLLENISEARAYSHKKCGGFMIDEPICWECGEPTSNIGRKVFIYNID